MPTEKRPPLPTLGRFAAYTAVGCTVLAVFALGWLLREVILLAFGAIIFAVIIRTLAHPLIRRWRIHERWAVTVVVVALLIAATGVSWLFGHQIAAQLKGVAERVPQALEEVRRLLEESSVGQVVLKWVTSADGALLENAQKFVTGSAATIGHALLMLFTGIYLAANPGLYLGGLVRLFPTHERSTLHRALVDAGAALQKWLLGQLASMTLVGVLTGAGLWLVGAPMPLALGILAALVDFIPVIGPVLAFVPGVLVALTESPQVALYAAIVFLIVQQLEGNIITPIAQRWAVKLPPALGLISIVAAGLLFGLLGVVFGSPLAVVMLSLVQNLYIRKGLEKERAPRAEATT